MVPERERQARRARRQADPRVAARRRGQRSDDAPRRGAAARTGSSVAPSAAATTASTTGDRAPGEERAPCALRPPHVRGSCDASRRGVARTAFRSSAARAEARGRLAGSRASAPSTAASSRRGRSLRSVPSGGAPASIAPATSCSGTPQNGWRPDRASQSRTPTAQTSLSGVASSPARRSGAMYASVPGTSPTAVSVSAPSNWASPKSSRRDGDLVAVLEEDVRRLHVSVHDSGPVGVRQGVQYLRRDLDDVLVRDRLGAQHLAQRPPGHVLVGDVDVARVVPDVVRAHAAVVTQPPGGERLALGAGSGLPLPRDDLERDVQAAPLVEGEPDRAGAAAPERAHGAIAAEDELSGGRGDGDGGHGYRPSWRSQREVLRGRLPGPVRSCASSRVAGGHEQSTLPSGFAGKRCPPHVPVPLVIGGTREPARRGHPRLRLLRRGGAAVVGGARGARVRRPAARPGPRGRGPSVPRARRTSPPCSGSSRSSRSRSSSSSFSSSGRRAARRIASRSATATT